MLLIGVLLLSVGLAAAQDCNTCGCYAYWVCKDKPNYDPNKCDDLYEVYCDLGITDLTTTSTQPQDQTPLGINQSICGIRGKPKEEPGSTIDWKITDNGGDTSTFFGEYPWMVAIMNVSTSTPQFLCGGSIIYNNLILTTAHSIGGLTASDLRVKAGIWSTTDSSETSKHQDRAVKEIVLHSNYSKAKAENDFALLVLDEALTITDNVAPICLPSPTNPYNRTYCIATGWGAESFGSKNIQNQLRKVTLGLVDFDACQSKIREVHKMRNDFNLHSSFICAGGVGGDTCTGDGGGPLICSLQKEPNTYVQVGITSWGIGCGTSTPGVYSSVEKVINWIEEQADLFPGYVQNTASEPPMIKPRM